MIRIDLRSSRGDVLRSLPVDPAFDPVSAGVDRSRYPILGHLDPYGDTILNRMQVETLIHEISRIRAQGQIIADGFAEELIALCAECLSRPHRFIWFIGE
jgi:hypothetical protein